MNIKIHKFGKYELLEDFTYYSPRYYRSVTVKAGIFDGATGAMDVTTKGWWVHDQVCNDPFFDDGSPITATMAATILYDILDEEGRWFRKFTWSSATFLFGCHNARKNK